jgi:hypothetical protein
MKTLDRINIIANRVANFEIESKQADDTVFSAVFAVVRENAKKYKDELEYKAQGILKEKLINELSSMGLSVLSVEISLGQYRGSRFVTSGKIRVETGSKQKAHSVEKMLQKYHKKYVMKEFDLGTGVAEYNFR